MATESFAIGLVVIGTIIGSFGGFYLKKGSGKVSFNIWRWLTNWNLYYGAVFYVIASFFSIIALKFGDLSVLYPFASLTYIWIILFSKFLLKERITKWKWMGIFLILVGVLI